MPYDRPTLTDLDNRLIADIESRLPGTDPRLRRAFLYALVRGIAGSHHELYGFLQWISEQAFPDSAEDVELRRWAAIWGITPNLAVQATGMIAVTGTNGTVIPEGTEWQSGLSIRYQSTAEVTIAAGVGTVSIEAVIPGANANIAMGSELTLISPIAGLVSTAEASTIISGGADAESNESVQARLLRRIQQPPRGGTTDDYELWALSGHSDVTRAWARARASGLGTVTVYIMTDGATANGIPGAAVVAAIQAYTDARRPVTADVTVAAPTAVQLDITITDLVPSTAVVQAAVQAEIADLILRESEPGGTILISHIQEAISTAAGETDHMLTIPAANVVVQADEITVLGDFTWLIL